MRTRGFSMTKRSLKSNKVKGTYSNVRLTFTLKLQIQLPVPCPFMIYFFWTVREEKRCLRTTVRHLRVSLDKSALVDSQSVIFGWLRWGRTSQSNKRLSAHINASVLDSRKLVIGFLGLARDFFCENRDFPFVVLSKHCNFAPCLTIKPRKERL